MYSISPLVGGWLYKLKRHDKIKEFWAKLIAITLIPAIKAVLSTISLYYAISASGNVISSELLLAIGIISLTWALTLTLAGAGAGAGAIVTAFYDIDDIQDLAVVLAVVWAVVWAVGLAVVSKSWAESVVVGLYGGMLVWFVIWAVRFTVGWALGWTLAAKNLLESFGKWKATVILFGTGFIGLFVGLLVKVLFVR